MKSKKSSKVVYNVEMWSNDMRVDPWHEGPAHYTHLAHQASSLEKAKEYCESNSNYGGRPGGYEYYPWHWRIFERIVDIDEGEVIGSDSFKCVATLNPDGTDWNEEVEEEYDSDEPIDAEFEEVETTPKKETPYDLWEKWWQTACDHHASPVAYQAWDGAIDTILPALMNELCSSFNIDKLDAAFLKIKNKFKNHP